MTPSGAASPYAPYTPGAAVDQPPLQEWHTVDIEVRIRDTHDDPGLCSQTGIIRGISVSVLTNMINGLPLVSVHMIILKIMFYVPRVDSVLSFYPMKIVL